MSLGGSLLVTVRTVLLGAGLVVGTVSSGAAQGTPPAPAPAPPNAPAPRPVSALLPRAELKGLERIASELAKGGHGAAWQTVVATLRHLGLPEQDATALTTAGDKELARRKKPAADGDKLAKALAAEVARLARSSTGREPESARDVAALLLRLDGACEAAHVAAGHERGPRGFGPPGELARSVRAAERGQALQQSRKLPIAAVATTVGGDSADGFGVGPSGGLAAHFTPMARVQVGDLIVLSNRSPAQLARIVTRALRSLAVLEFMLHGKLEVPKHDPMREVMLETKAQYEQAIGLAQTAGWITASRAAEARKLGGFYTSDHCLVAYDTTEAEASAVILCALADGLVREPVLQAGLLNWLCRASLGTPLPMYAWRDTQETLRRAQASATSDPRVQAQRIELLALAEAGLAGGRAYLRFLAAQREDPPWAAAMENEVGKIQGEPLLKATFVAEYLLDEGTLGAIVRKLDGSSEGSIQDRCAAAVGMPLTELDARFRAWLVGLGHGVVQDLATPRTTMARPTRAVVDLVDALRRSAFTAGSASVHGHTPLGHDEESSAGCVAHASYLAAHPDMASRWPDAHEENDEHAEWSAAGAWAGGHSVIAPGVASGEAAVHAWMATFFHRLPLLDPGLRRIGFGLARGVAVLDSGSFVEVRPEAWHVAWPPAGASDVPTRFEPELPNPVPGEDQSRFGYPITLQFGIRTDHSEPHAVLRLFENGRNGREVPCWFSTPSAPLNPDLAPAGSFCLIPKAPLRAGTKHTVVATVEGGEELVWSWQTK